jgi:hypothetical protein
MQNNNIQIGMKVVPHAKTAYFNGLDSSIAWRNALEMEQKFLYVLDQDKTVGYWLLNDIANPVILDGDYFNACDFEPYVEKL